MWKTKWFVERKERKKRGQEIERYRWSDFPRGRHVSTAILFASFQVCGWVVLWRWSSTKLATATHMKLQLTILVGRQPAKNLSIRPKDRRFPRNPRLFFSRIVVLHVQFWVASSDRANFGGREICEQSLPWNDVAPIQQDSRSPHFEFVGRHLTQRLTSKAEAQLSGDRSR